MTIQELKTLCENALESPISGGKVSLLIPGHAGHGNSKRFPGTGILGEIVCEYDKECLCAFPAKKILALVEAELDKEK